MLWLLSFSITISLPVLFADTFGDDDLFNGPIFNPQPVGTAGANP